MPNKATVLRWIDENKEFLDQYVKATDIRADAIEPVVAQRRVS